MRMNFLSLFAGVGGIDLGLERAGMTAVGQVEIIPFAKSVLDRHWPEVPKHDDVRTTPQWWASTERPPVHIIAGGFPCQPFSRAGKRLGTADERWGWPWMADVIRTVRPDYVFVENVASLIDDSGAFGCVLADLAGCGFDAEWAVLSAPEFAAPQSSRERVYLVAYPAGQHGRSWDLLGTGRDGETPFTAGGLSGIPASERGGQRVSGLVPNPVWIGWLMGFPPDWHLLPDTETL